MIVIGGLAPHRDHGVDGGAAADHLAAGIGERAAVQARLRPRSETSSPNADCRSRRDSRPGCGTRSSCRCRRPPGSARGFRDRPTAGWRRCSRRCRRPRRYSRNHLQAVLPYLRFHPFRYTFERLLVQRGTARTSRPCLGGARPRHVRRTGACMLDRQCSNRSSKIPCPSSTASPICNPISRPGAGTSTSIPSCCMTCTAPQPLSPSACANSAATRSRPASARPASSASSRARSRPARATSR